VPPSRPASYAIKASRTRAALPPEIIVSASDATTPPETRLHERFLRTRKAPWNAPRARRRPVERALSLPAAASLPLLDILLSCALRASAMVAAGAAMLLVWSSA
jgi:hypothetical protein